MVIFLKAAAVKLSQFYPNASKMQKIIIQCAAIAAGLNLLGAVIDELAIPAMMMACIIGIWGMYVRLAKAVGILNRRNQRKLFVSAILSNVIAVICGVLIGFGVAVLFPDAEILGTAVSVFGIVYCAGMFFQWMTADLVRR